MSDLLHLMAAPFAACIVLVGIHAYLGMHVIQRRVIFVDLALAQIAALGATSCYLLGLSPHGTGAYLFSLGFAVAGAAIFAVTRMRHERIPQEAIIGIVYAVALAGAILVADRAPEGAEHIKETLVGSLLWVTWPTVIKTAVIYALVGGLHVALRRRFFQISFAPEEAYAEGRWVRVWDFIFYVTFAFVITSSVAMAGVLLVFSFLVIPAVIAILFAHRVSVRLVIGWSVGIAACLIGLVASYRFDLPSGPAVVTSLGIALLLAATLYSIVSAPRRGHALLKAAAGAVVVLGLLAVPLILRGGGTSLHIPHHHEWEPSTSGPAGPAVNVDPWSGIAAACGADVPCMAARLRTLPDWSEVLEARLALSDVDQREAAVRVAAALDDPGARDLLAAAASRERDDLLRLEEARALARQGDARGLELAVGFLESGVPLLFRQEAHQLLVEAAGRDVGGDPTGTTDASRSALGRWRTWVEEHRARAR